MTRETQSIDSEEGDFPVDPRLAAHPALVDLVRLIAREAACESLAASKAESRDPAPPEAEPATPLLTLQYVADALDVSLRTVRRRVDQGDLPVVRDGGIRRVRPADFERYVHERRRT